MSSNEAEHGKQREVMEKDQEELVRDMGSIWKSFQQHIEILTRVALGACDCT